MMKLSMMKMKCMNIMVLRICINTPCKVWFYIHKCMYTTFNEFAAIHFLLGLVAHYDQTNCGLGWGFLAMNSPSYHIVSWSKDPKWRIYLFHWMIVVCNLELQSLRSGEDNCLCKTWQRDHIYIIGTKCTPYSLEWPISLFLGKIYWHTPDSCLGREGCQYILPRTDWLASRQIYSNSGFKHNSSLSTLASNWYNRVAMAINRV